MLLYIAMESGLSNEQNWRLMYVNSNFFFRDRTKETFSPVFIESDCQHVKLFGLFISVKTSDCSVLIRDVGLHISFDKTEQVEEIEIDFWYAELMKSGMQRWKRLWRSKHGSSWFPLNIRYQRFPDDTEQLSRRISSRFILEEFAYSLKQSNNSRKKRKQCVKNRTTDEQTMVVLRWSVIFDKWMKEL